MVIAKGFFLVFVAGITIGGNLLPMKWMKAWKWENFWLVYSVVSLVIVPFGLAFFLIPHLGRVYGSIPLHSMALPVLYGAAWGIAQLGAGICVHRIGLGLTASILNGICAATGTFIPLCLQHSEMLLQRSGLLIIAGTLVMAVGLALCGRAGNAREHATRQLKSTGSGYWGILVLAVISGVLAALLNIALAFGGDIMAAAREAGAAQAWAPFAVWPIALAGGFLTNLAYCIYKLSRNKTWGNFSANPREILNPVLGGLVWMIAIAIYSSATTFLGVLGVSVGWALFQILMILSGNLAGVLTGEWRQMEARISRLNQMGVGFLFLALALIGASNY